MKYLLFISFFVFSLFLGVLTMFVEFTYGVFPYGLLLPLIVLLIGLTYYLLQRDFSKGEVSFGSNLFVESVVPDKHFELPSGLKVAKLGAYNFVGTQSTGAGTLIYDSSLVCQNGKIIHTLPGVKAQLYNFNLLDPQTKKILKSNKCDVYPVYIILADTLPDELVEDEQLGDSTFSHLDLLNRENNLLRSYLVKFGIDIDDFNDNMNWISEKTIAKLNSKKSGKIAKKELEKNKEVLE